MIRGETWMNVKQMKNSGMTITEIGRFINADRKTVRKLLKHESSPVYERKTNKQSLLEDYKEYIELKLSKNNLTAQKLYKEILNQGYIGKYGIVSKYVTTVKDTVSTKAMLRFETLPGEQAQVDWGYFGNFYDNELKQNIRLCCFFMVLGFSRKKFIYFFNGDNTDNFLLGHNLAFKYFNGYTKEILYDNLKSVVIKRAFRVKDSEFNKKFTDFAGFYGFNPILARPYKPSTKGKVERTVRYVREDFFNGETFHSLEELNNEAMKWLDKVDNKIHYGTYKIPNEQFKQEQLTEIKKYYDLSKTIYRQVQKDCLFCYETNYYSVPYLYANKEVSIKKDFNKLYVYYRNEVIAVHIVHNGKHFYVVSQEHRHELKIIKNSFYNKSSKLINIEEFCEPQCDNLSQYEACI